MVEKKRIEAVVDASMLGVQLILRWPRGPRWKKLDAVKTDL